MSDHHDLSPHIYLPPELWEEVILELGVVNALKMRVVSPCTYGREGSNNSIL